MSHHKNSKNLQTFGSSIGVANLKGLGWSRNLGQRRWQDGVYRCLAAALWQCWQEYIHKSHTLVDCSVKIQYSKYSQSLAGQTGQAWSSLSGSESKFA